MLFKFTYKMIPNMANFTHRSVPQRVTQKISIFSFLYLLAECTLHFFDTKVPFGTFVVKNLRNMFKKCGKL